MIHVMSSHAEGVAADLEWVQVDLKQLLLINAITVIPVTRMHQLWILSTRSPGIRFATWRHS